MTEIAIIPHYRKESQINGQVKHASYLMVQSKLPKLLYSISWPVVDWIRPCLNERLRWDSGEPRRFICCAVCLSSVLLLLSSEALVRVSLGCLYRTP